MTSAFDPVAAQRHEWNRNTGAWHLAFGVLAVVTAGLMFESSGLTTLERVGAMALLCSLCGWYAGIAAPILHHEPRRRGMIYLVVAVPMTVGLYAVSPVGAVMMFILYPHVWTLLSTRRAMVGTTVSVSATGAVVLTQVDGLSEEIFGVVAMVLVGIAVAFTLGLWITRIIDQSNQRADLLAQLAATRAELAEAERLAGASEERERLAREIHDTLAQGFASTVLLMDAASRDVGSDDTNVRDLLTRATNIAKDNLAEARGMIATLVPPALREASLPDALRQLVTRLGAADTSSCEVTVQGTPRPLSSDQETAILRIVQEALANCRKHADAEHVKVTLTYEPARTSIQIVDDGCGFDPDEALAGYGLPSMRQRASLANGTLQISAATGQGVSIEAEFAT